MPQTLQVDTLCVTLGLFPWKYTILFTILYKQNTFIHQIWKNHAFLTAFSRMALWATFGTGCPNYYPGYTLPYFKSSSHAWAYGKEKIRGAERNLPDFFGLCPTSPKKLFVEQINFGDLSPPRRQKNFGQCTILGVRKFFRTYTIFRNIKHLFHTSLN
jgi:hypothetical protein